MTQWITEIIHQPERIAIPIMTNPGIELCNHHILDAVKKGAVHAQAIQKLDEIYPAGASTVIMDLTVEAEAFGSEILFSENEVPTVTGILVSDMESVKALQVPDLATGRIQEYLLANRLTAENITDKPVLAGCIGPFSLAGRLFGMTEIMMALYTEPDTIILLLEKCTTFLLQYTEAIKTTGVNGIVIAEPAAGLISNEDCSRYSSMYIKEMVEKLQDDTFSIILHNCGNTGHCTPAMLETKAAGLHMGNKADMVQILRSCPDDILLMGNLDPVGVLKMGCPKQIKEQTKSLLEATKDFKNFVLSTGCDVPPHVPLQNIETFYSALKAYNECI